jgi:hypothetical protein
VIFDLYKYAVAAVSAAVLLLWFVQPQWGTAELFAAFLILSPIYGPLLYRLGMKAWVARQRRELDLPPASDRDIIDFIGEDLDPMSIVWQWRVAMGKTSTWDTLDVGEDDEPPITVRVRHGLVEISTEEVAVSRFVDPVAAIDHILILYDGASKQDEEIFVDLEEAVE